MMNWRLIIMRRQPLARLLKVFRATTLHSTLIVCHIFEVGRRLEESADPRAMRHDGDRAADGTPYASESSIMLLRLLHFMILLFDGFTATLSLVNLLQTSSPLGGCEARAALPIDQIFDHPGLLVAGLSLSGMLLAIIVKTIRAKPDRFLPPDRAFQPFM
jgi:hypothetical protein